MPRVRGFATHCSYYHICLQKSNPFTVSAYEQAKKRMCPNVYVSMLSYPCKNVRKYMYIHVFICIYTCAFYAPPKINIFFYFDTRVRGGVFILGGLSFVQYFLSPKIGQAHFTNPMPFCFFWIMCSDSLSSICDFFDASGFFLFLDFFVFTPPNHKSKTFRRHQAFDSCFKPPTATSLPQGIV